MAGTCEKCRTPLDDEGACVTCAAEAEGLKNVRRGAFAQVRELMTLLEEQGIGAEMEQVPATTKEERHHPRWNLYVPVEELEKAAEWLQRDWAGLLEDPAAAEAAARGMAGVDLSAGGEIACPACGTKFTATAGQADCPECGLSLGVEEPEPGEGQDRGAGERG